MLTPKPWVDGLTSFRSENRVGSNQARPCITYRVITLMMAMVAKIRLEHRIPLQCHLKACNTLWPSILCLYACWPSAVVYVCTEYDILTVTPAHLLAHLLSPVVRVPHSYASAATGASRVEWNKHSKFWAAKLSSDWSSEPIVMIKSVDSLLIGCANILSRRRRRTMETTRACA